MYNRAGLFIDTSMNLDIKAGNTVSIHKPETYGYFQGNGGGIKKGKQSFYPIQKPLLS